MKAWHLDRLGGALTLKDIDVPEPRPGSVLLMGRTFMMAPYDDPNYFHPDHTGWR